MNDAKPWFDSSIIHFAAGCIGYRWAVKVTKYIAHNPSSVRVDALFFTEILERYPRLASSDVGAEIYFQVRKMFAQEKIEEICVDDFLNSAINFTANSKAGPRLNLRLALMKKNNCREYLATFATGIEHVETIERVNFMDRIS